MKWLIVALGMLALSGAAQAQGPATPLFVSDAPIRISIQGPVNLIARRAADSVEAREATLVLTAPAESHPIRLSARGLSRRTAGICSFPPLRVEFAQPPPPTSLFAGQRRLKLVTHCKSNAGHQQHLLLEYAAYRLLNELTPLSYRARLATVDYMEPNGKISATRWGFFIEDLDDAARRNGLKPAQVGDRIFPNQLEPQQAARIALFEYMIGNLDWSLRAGPAGEGCCHNSRLLAGRGSTLLPVAYDFDYSGFVDAPYALPPDGIKVSSVRDRAFRGYCWHNRESLAAAAEFRAKRGAIEAALGQVPGLTDRTRSKALAYLASFYREAATDETVNARILKECLR